ncbi:hypothetical protein [Streptacidiphilus cavernicola]|uniref:Uncharacterized protein n=1 Tax=Streptacidiphilus cavernicola TaxID=3342716 RepID=A0ABV6W6C8_9ACTN
MNLTPMVMLLAALVSCTADIPGAAREGRIFLRHSKHFGKRTLRRLRVLLGASTTNTQNTSQITAKQTLVTELRACNPERHDTSFEEYRPS